MEVIKESTNVEEFIPINANNSTNECYTCRRSEDVDRMKLIERSNQTAALINEETKLKSLHRRLEMRIKRFLHHTRNSILLEEKLLEIEKRSHKELILRQIPDDHGQSLQKYNTLSNRTQQVEAKNIKLKENIAVLCNKIKLMEKDLEQKKQNCNHQSNNDQQYLSVQKENQLHRMNLKLSKICADNVQLRTEIKRMLDKRRKMTDEYNRLSIVMQNATDESRRLTSECSESFANRRNLVARMRAMRDQHDRDEKKLLDDIRELDRLLERNHASKSFILKKSNMRQEYVRLNELFAGKRSKGAQSAYTADEFHRLFRYGFNQDFHKEKILNRTVENFLNEQERSFTLFEYVVELINELDHLHDELDKKRNYISNLFSSDNIDSFAMKDIFAKLEYSVNQAHLNVQSFDIAKENLRSLLDAAYELIYDFFIELNCDRNFIFSSSKTIYDRNILAYLATIESRVQQLLPTKRVYQKGGVHHDYIDDTTISWRLDHRNTEQLSLLTNTHKNRQFRTTNLHELDSLTPQIVLTEQNAATHGTEQIVPTEIIDTILNVYNDCIHVHPSIRHMNNNLNLIDQTNETKL
ncbi:unnamed protein product [Adineta ricciae]|uniref:ODAD1 central coiled coil region domain-containing protein n=1 Tax=Adineta ricciae TaxID=249248 RepID=A0A814SK66_ADIRI|nr:unnamed protein product [Adineta ricciae]CAF1148535.1 unnamed protein product [Adineta ricciae]